MEATIIYNPNAGGTSLLSLEDIKEMLQNAGYHPVHKATTCEEDLEEALQDVSGLILLVGGDGTIRAACKKLIGRPNVQIAMIPLGTANNIARAIGMVNKAPSEIIAGLSQARQLPFDVGRLKAAWGTEYFFEAFGCGLFADTLATYDPSEGKNVIRSLATLKQLLPDYKPYSLSFELDGESMSGQYLLFEVLNTHSTGPRIKLAPDASPSDGVFEVVLVQDNDRAGLLTYLTHLTTENLENLPNVEIKKARKIRLAWDSFPIHLDGTTRTDIVDPANPVAMTDKEITKAQDHPYLEIEVLASALTFLLPND
jgi:diacylglycerol kinase (ATP)